MGAADQAERLFPVIVQFILHQQKESLIFPKTVIFLTKFNDFTEF